MIPQFNPEFTFGSLGVILTLIFTWGSLYAKFAGRITNSEKAIADLRGDLNLAIDAMRDTHRETINILRDEHRDLQKDLKVHMAANSEQHMAMMTALADLKLGNAVASNDIDGIKRVQDQHAARIDAISARQTEFIRHNLRQPGE